MLETLGLTTYETDAYTTLLKLGQSDARQVSNNSGVPFGRIYDILSLLESKELVIVQPSRPKQFRPVEPDQAIEKLMALKKQEFENVKRQAKKVSHELNQLYNPADQEELFWKVGIGDDLIPSYIEIMKQAEQELLGYIELHPSISLADIDFFVEVLGDLIRKDVKIKLLVGTTNPDQIRDIMDQYHEVTNQIAVRFGDPMTEPFNIIDQDKVVIKVRNPINPREDFAYIFLWKEELAVKLREIYKQLWSKAVDL